MNWRRGNIFFLAYVYIMFTGKQLCVTLQSTYAISVNYISATSLDIDMTFQTEFNKKKSIPLITIKPLI